MERPIAGLRSVLVANRGEIAIRVLRTCRRLGLEGVAIFTPVDAAGPHLRLADRSLPVDSYLDVDAVIAAAKASGADAIHPGYGFLSERAELARAVERAGLVLIGPSATVMEQLGRKDAAREIAVAAGVPVVPGYAMHDHPAEMAFPVIVKAAAGGGGKGMRIVADPAELTDAIAAAGRESKAAFGDDTLLIEAYIEHGRHIEVQILADRHGTVLHLHERDCSVQRRHQKVVEEAPAPTLDDRTRAEITGAAVSLASAVGYVNAGTVEFLLDSDSGAFYFLEMNTRLQVEHAVTEAVCGGIDLVEQQLRIAAGERLGLRQDEVVIRGHAIEARVYAEDPYQGFLPQAGIVSTVRWPGGPQVRVDEALEDGQEVTTAYDPMLGKIIVHGPDRASARRRLVTALDRTTILGLTTNVGFLRRLVAGPEFAAAAIDVGWLDREPLSPPALTEARVVAAWLTAERIRTATSAGPFAADGWRLASTPATVVLEFDQVLDVDLASGVVSGQHGTRWSVADRGTVAGLRRLAVDGRELTMAASWDHHGIELAVSGQRFRFAPPDVFGDHEEAVGSGGVLAPMPSVVIEVRVQPGDEVTAGQVLGVVEAMKMEVALRAPFAGRLTEVTASPGDRVRQGDRLFTVEPGEG